MSDLQKYLSEQLKEELFREEYENTREEFAFRKEMIRTRMEKGMTQKQLADKIGLRQSNISRIENGAVVPNVSTLLAIARGLDKKLEIHFTEK
ncbi:MAG: helix-turn-helix domain-containing protein [Lachnospiraceae bacterium]